MADFLRLLLSLSLSGGALTLFAALLYRLLRRKKPQKFLYYLWLPVLLRFLIPVGTDWSLTNRLLVASETVLTSVADVTPVTPPESRQGGGTAPIPSCGGQRRRGVPC